MSATPATLTQEFINTVQDIVLDDAMRILLCGFDVQEHIVHAGGLIWNHNSKSFRIASIHH